MKDLRIHLQTKLDIISESIELGVLADDDYAVYLEFYLRILYSGDADPIFLVYLAILNFHNLAKLHILFMINNLLMILKYQACSY